MVKKFLVALVASMALSPAFAVVTFTLSENAGDVVLTASGSLDTTGLVAGSTVPCSSSGTGGVFAGQAVACVGSGLATVYSGSTGPLAGPADFGSGGSIDGTTTSGDTVFVAGRVGAIALPTSYTSGSPLSGTTTFAGATLASLGVTPGTFTWTLQAAGGRTETIVLLAGAPATSVPTLGEYALLALAGLLVLGTLPMLRGRT